MYRLTVPSPSQIRQQQLKLQQQQHISHQLQQLKITKHTFSDIQGLKIFLVFMIVLRHLCTYSLHHLYSNVLYKYNSLDNLIYYV